MSAEFSDDGRFLAVQQPGGKIDVFDTVSRTLTAIPGPRSAAPTGRTSAGMPLATGSSSQPARTAQ